MALQYGTNLTANAARSMIEQNDRQRSGVKSWKQLFGGAALGANQQQSQLVSSYSDAAAQAYEANLRQQHGLQGAGLSKGALDTELGISRQDLQNTYRQYMQNYGSDLSTAQQNYAGEVGQIQGALGDRAANTAAVYNAGIDYLYKELAEAYKMEHSGESELSEIVRKAYLEQQKDFEWMLEDKENADGTISRGLISREQLMQLLDPSNPNNKAGSATSRQAQLFNMIFDNQVGDYQVDREDESDPRARGFDQYLSDTNPELREWFASPDGFNYTAGGTNRATLKQQVGLDTRNDTDHMAELMTDDQKASYQKKIDETIAGMKMPELKDQTFKHDAFDLGQLLGNKESVNGEQTVAELELQGNAYKDEVLGKADELLKQASSLSGVDLRDDPQIAAAYKALQDIDMHIGWYDGFEERENMKPPAQVYKQKKERFKQNWNAFVNAVKNYSGNRTKYGY